MLLMFFLAIVACAILYGALHIILGWLLPAKALKHFDSMVAATMSLIFKLLVLGLAAIIIWAIWTGMQAGN